MKRKKQRAYLKPDAPPMPVDPALGSVVDLLAVPIEAPAVIDVDLTAALMAEPEKATTLVVEPSPLVYEDLTDLQPMVRAAIVGLGLRRSDVVGHRQHDDQQGATLVTRGGRKLRWPEDQAKAASLTAADKSASGKEWPRWFPKGIDGKRA